ncbi:MAG TPA: DNA recombination protein RmuC [Phycisphaerae bacterium]|nr:DNA recombination protein RmuC [Phycisphaerae bacterium]
MSYILPAITVALVFLILVLLLKQRTGGGAAAAVEAELRQRTADLEADARTLQGELADERQARVQAETRLEAERANLAEQRRLLGEAEVHLKDAFKALSADALKNTGEQFLGAAGERLRPIQDLLKAYEDRLGQIEKARTDAYGGLKNRLDALAQAHQALQKEAHQLSTALRSPTVRGRWGEMALRNVVEAAGMSPHCDFHEQTSTATEDGRIRPDLTVNLPNHRIIVVDAKVPLEAYMEAMESDDEGRRQAALDRHAQALRAHVQQLCQKAYWKQFQNTPDFVVLFIPAESFFSAALEADRSLMEDAFRSNVILASPATLIALLRAVACGWQEEALAENAEKIGQTGRELFERVATFVGHFARVGDGLKKAAEAYDGAVGSYESRVKPAARRLADQTAVSDAALPDVESARHPTRLIADTDDGGASPS